MIFRKGYGYDDVLLVPKFSNIESRKEVDLSTRFTTNVYLKFPLVSAPMDTVTGPEMAKVLGNMGALGILHRFAGIETRLADLEKLPRGFYRAVSIGVNKGWYESTKELSLHGADIFVMDVAHAHHKMVFEALEKFKADYSLNKKEIMIGNIATKEAAKELCELGVNGLKVGVGNGSACSTRLEAGAGVPQLSAILEIVEVARKYDVPVCADGGIRFSGDIVKALAAGADTIMSGGLFAATKESPGHIMTMGYGHNRKNVKEYRGSASYNAKISDGRKNEHVEGFAQFLPYKGSVVPIVETLVQGVKSGCSYVGARNLEELRHRAEFVEVSSVANHLPKMSM